MKSASKEKIIKRKLRHSRVRSRARGSSKVPRATVFRSLSHIYLQLIDDSNGSTILAADDRGLGVASSKGKTKTDIARLLGRTLGEKAKEKKIGEVIFDRGGFKYHGRVKAVAEGLREAGIKL